MASRRLWNYLSGGAGLLSGAVLLHAVWQLYWRLPGRPDFFRNNAQYDQIVRDVQGYPRQAEGRANIRGVAVYWICGSSNAYTITLVTSDRGHFGKAGYLYSDGPIVRKTGDAYSDVEAPGDLWMLGQQVAPHWWTVTNNLN